MFSSVLMFSCRSNYNKIPSDYMSMSASLCSIAQDGRAVSLHPWWPKDRPPERHCHIDMQPMLPFANIPFLLAVEGRSFPVPTSEQGTTTPTDEAKCFPRLLQAIAQERSKPNHRATSAKELWNARMSTHFNCMSIIKVSIDGLGPVACEWWYSWLNLLSWFIWFVQCI